MANVPKVLKEKIAKTNRKEPKGASQVIGEMKPNLRSIVADLRRRVFVLERENKRLMAAINKFRVESAQKSDEKTAKPANVEWDSQSANFSRGK